MASPLDSDDESIFRQLQRNDSQYQQEKTLAEEASQRAQTEGQQKFLAQLVDNNSTLACSISSVQVDGATRTRKGFLARIFNPLLEPDAQQPTTLGEALNGIAVSVQKLQKLDIFQPQISVSLAPADPSQASTTKADLDVLLSVREKSRLLIKTGTDVGNAEGSAYVNALARNVFGGAESVSVNASLGTRTRSEYSATFETPLLSNPDFRWQMGGLSSCTQKPWMSHEDVLRGGWGKLKWTRPDGVRHELGYSGFWRQIFGLTKEASETVRGDAGDSVKSSLTYGWTLDKRDNPFLPSSGVFTKTLFEVAGWGPLGGDVAFGKAEIEAQAVQSLSSIKSGLGSGISFTSSFRAGLLYPLTLGSNIQHEKSRVNDRFQLGGPADVRGFRLSGLGPHDGVDAVGGDVYAAGSANVLFPLPRVQADRPLRLQAFITGGRLLALQHPGKGFRSHGEIKSALSSTIQEIGNGLPSMSAGFGLVYAAPMARIELNLSLPLVIREGESGRKGLSFGVGISMM